MANQYHVGDLVRCTGSFKNSAGASTDPSGVTAKIKTPAGTTITYIYGVDAQLVKESTGVYYVDVSATTNGTWYYRFAGTGTGQSADENYFRVVDSQFD